MKGYKVMLILGWVICLLGFWAEALIGINEATGTAFAMTGGSLMVAGVIWFIGEIE